MTTVDIRPTQAYATSWRHYMEATTPCEREARRRFIQESVRANEWAGTALDLDLINPDATFFFRSVERDGMIDLILKGRDGRRTARALGIDGALKVTKRKDVRGGWWVDGPTFAAPDSGRVDATLIAGPDVDLSDLCAGKCICEWL